MFTPVPTLNRFLPWLRVVVSLATFAIAFLFTGCGMQEVVDKAKADFAARHPEWKISKAYIGEGDDDHAYVHVQYVSTPAAVFPKQPVIMEMVLGYQRATNGWQLFHEQGSKYIGPVR
jgi:hypothetical protein